MIARAALLAVAALVASGCSLRGEDAAEPGSAPEARYLVYTKQVGLRGEAIWIGDVDGRKMRRLAPGYGALVSPDGRKVAFHRCLGSFEACRSGGGRSAVYVVAPDGRGERRIDGITSAHEWFADSRHLLALGNRPEALLRADSEGGAQDVLFRKADLLRGWSVAEDGRRVAYSAAASESRGLCPPKMDLYVVDADGRSRRLTTDGRSARPVWSGDWILFARYPPKINCLSPAAGVWRMRGDGTRATPIVARAPPQFARNGYYGLTPYGDVRGSPLLLAGAITEWGNELVLVDTRSGGIRLPDLDPRPRARAPMYVGYVSRDGRHAVGTACGAEFPCSINVYSVLERRGRTIATGRVAGAHWNR